MYIGVVIKVGLATKNFAHFKFREKLHMSKNAQFFRGKKNLFKFALFGVFGIRNASLGIPSDKKNKAPVFCRNWRRQKMKK
jgi:hypothetical protein